MARSAIDAGYDVTVYARGPGPRSPGCRLSNDPGPIRLAAWRSRASGQWTPAGCGGNRPFGAVDPGRLCVLERGTARAGEQRGCPGGDGSANATSGSPPGTLPWWIPRRLRGTRLSPYVRSVKSRGRDLSGPIRCSGSRCGHLGGRPPWPRSRSLPISGTGCGRARCSPRPAARQVRRPDGVRQP